MFAVASYARELREYTVAAAYVVSICCFAGFLAAKTKRPGTVFFLSVLALIFTFRIATISNKLFTSVDRISGIKNLGMIPMGITLAIAVYILTSFVFRLRNAGLAFLMQGAVYPIAFLTPPLLLSNYQMADFGLYISLIISVGLSSLIWTIFITSER